VGVKNSMKNNILHLFKMKQIQEFSDYCNTNLWVTFLFEANEKRFLNVSFTVVTKQHC